MNEERCSCRHITSIIGFAFLLVATGCGTSEPLLPNFVFILADDLGWNQLGCYGSSFYETPNLDRVASEGMRFTDAYSASPVCTPTRASIMTGKNPARLGITAGALQDRYLELEEVTIAEALKPVGYVSAAFGKWHLNPSKAFKPRKPYDPDKQGFNEYFRTVKPSLFEKYLDDPRWWLPDDMRNMGRQVLEQDAHWVEELTDRSVDFMERNRDKPFFLYLAPHSIHLPLREQDDLIEKYRSKPEVSLPENHPVVGAMIERLDLGVGRVLESLERLGISDRTAVFFFSDNGGLERDADQTPLRAGKANLYEGGIRVPLIVRWPNAVPAGTVSSSPVISHDFLPTLLEITGLDVSNEDQLDGVSLLPLLRESGPLDRTALHWQYPHRHEEGAGASGAIREGDFKLIEFFEADRFELYNLREDLSEENDLADSMPEKVEALKKLLAQWRPRVRAEPFNPADPI